MDPNYSFPNLVICDSANLGMAAEGKKRTKEAG